MKIVILGDPHIGGGYNLGKIDSHRQLNSRLIDQSNLIDYVIDYCVSNSVNNIIITGDVFEHRRPQSSEIAIFAEKMARTSELEIHTHIVVGNHDLTISQNSTTLDFLEELKLPFVHVYSNIDSSIIRENGKEINFIFFPFRTRKMLRCKHNDDAISRLQDSINYAIRDDIPNILVGHLMIEGTNMSSAVMESALSEIVLPKNMFKKLDAAIMGHIHPHQIIQRKPLVCYIGSMDRSKFDEGGHKKYFMVVELNEDITYNFQTLPVRNLYDISINQSNSETGEDVFEGIKSFMSDFSENNSLSGSIVRLQIHTNEKALYGFYSDEVKSFLQNDFKVHNCVNVSTHVTSKRQLRKDTITEQVDPHDAFTDFLDMEDDGDLKERIRELGMHIISRSFE